MSPRERLAGRLALGVYAAVILGAGLGVTIRWP